MGELLKPSACPHRNSAAYRCALDSMSFYTNVLVSPAADKTNLCSQTVRYRENSFRFIITINARTFIVLNSVPNKPS